MSKKKIVILFMIIIICIVNILVIKYEPDITQKDIQVVVAMKSDNLKEIQYYYASDEQTPYTYTEEQSQKNEINSESDISISCSIKASTTSLRMDFGTEASSVNVTGVSVVAEGKTYPIVTEKLQDVVLTNDVTVTKEDDGLHIDASDGDPYIAWNLKTWDLDGIVKSASATWVILGKSIVCLVIDILLVIMIWKQDILLSVPSSLYYNYKITWRLAVNDFKTKYAGSYLGIFWAFVNPLVTTAVYWFVFQVGLKSGRTCDFPFVLWLMSGLVPWFFFQDALTGGTNALLEYNYLVKKVVFDIDILPVVKILAAFFIHVFFTVFILVLCICYGYFPTVYTLQIFYLMICNFVLSLGLAYLASAIVGFFRDLTQIINIILQVGVWMTPIMWDATQYLGPKLQLVMKLNPMYYIVEGYRDALLAKEWIIGDGIWTIYFWIVAVTIWIVGVVVFKKLKVHFADVL